eukprot:CAMPEP_0201550868 /NCGR_PEP_ID=MMETSP0173_2-20130828/7160_1 /ASSEMBLY_ACC=CAM_ASM_000268 /TAXON_ID=218659 /ORGANISM="Vexillifera sp., Strain DIVA3 564/2" /LENGTH=514 /DNA_ID=CAMNT_0047960971 /DNA_START=110 /DNA_END=1654 /DNA_ORIENTATION=+
MQSSGSMETSTKRKFNFAASLKFEVNDMQKITALNQSVESRDASDIYGLKYEESDDTDDGGSVTNRLARKSRSQTVGSSSATVPKVQSARQSLSMSAGVKNPKTRTTGVLQRRKNDRRFIQSHPGFNSELGTRSMETTGSGSDLKLEYSDEHDSFWYVDEFVKLNVNQVIDPVKRKCLLSDDSFHPHINVVGSIDASQVVISVLLTPNNSGDFRGIIRKPTEDKLFWVPGKDVKRATPKHLLRALCEKLPNLVEPIVVEDTELCRALVELEMILKIRKYKFGVVYIRDGMDEQDIFESDKVSTEFIEFMEFLGNRIELKGWTHYRGDLDVKHGGTGTHSYYRKWKELEIMLEVAPLLPQQRRKAIIGNTISTIVFQESGSFDPSLIVSQVLHVFFVVQPVKRDGKTYYRVATASKKGVPRYRPTLPSPPLYKLNDDFREFIFTKMINGERASYHCSSKVRRQKRSLVEIVQQTRTGQLTYAISRANMPKPKKKKSATITSLLKRASSSRQGIHR